MPLVHNRLGGETSPYLRQHADNPVHWQPWDAQALALARDSGRPILLSIGYSACHWCHVMAHECFENAAIAQRMNELFVNIKVDREERPDLDQIYQKAHLLIAQRAGGWPLTMFLTHDGQVPFFGGTYFPPLARHGLPGFMDVLERVAQFYRERAGEVTREADAIVAALERLDAVDAPEQTGAVTLSAEPLEGARAVMQANFDSQHGGFGSAPKFPHAAMLQTLLDGWADSLRGDDPHEDVELRYIALYSLERMGLGGLYDQLGGGFFRYCTDDDWQIPHFEKMLYDNAALLPLYARAARLAGDERFEAIAHGTARWLMREMQLPAGGFCAALDADAGGDEGAFYLWDRDAVRKLLGDERDFAIFAATYALDHSPNFEDKWHLRVVTDPHEVAERLGTDVETVHARLAAARRTLLAARDERPAPARDEKILTSWNGLTIGALAGAARCLGTDDYLAAAHRAVDFLRETAWRDGELAAVVTEGEARYRGYLDYAFLGLALLECLRVQWRDGDLAFATALADALLARFEDAERGGFWFTAHDHEPLIHRPKPFEDDATPSGNGAAVQLLTRLGHLLGRGDYLEAAARTLKTAWRRLEQHPQACAGLLAGLREVLQPAPVVILRGAEAALTGWRRGLAERARWAALDHAQVFAIPEHAELPAALAVRRPDAAADGVTAYVCRGTQCSAPLKTPEALLRALAG